MIVTREGGVAAMALPRIKFLGPVLLESGQTRRLSYKVKETEPPFQALHLFVPGGEASLRFSIVDIEVNGGKQKSDPSPIPAAAFSEDAMPIELGLPLLEHGDEVSLIVSNSSDAAAPFVALLSGKTIPNVDPRFGWDGTHHLVTIGPQPVEPGASAAFDVEVTKASMVQPKKLLVPGNVGRDFEITEVEVGGFRQNSGAFPAHLLDEHQVQRDANLKRMPALQFTQAAARGQRLHFAVKNISPEKKTFVGMIYGFMQP
jgi:hypothetical protein